MNGNPARHTRWLFVAAGRRGEEGRTTGDAEDAFAAAIPEKEHREVAAMFKHVIGAVDKVNEQCGNPPDSTGPGSSPADLCRSTIGGW